MTAAAAAPVERRGHPWIRTLLPAAWMAKKMSIQPFGADWWSFNPSIHHDRSDGAWRCIFRCANYSLPNGIPRLSKAARAGRAETRNVIARLDPGSLELSGLREVRELDDNPRSPTCSSLGYEDVRLFRTTHDGDGLRGIATALQLNLERPNVPEMVLVRLNEIGDIVEALPLRGRWSGRAQKNWSPFDGAETPRFLYSIERGVVMGDSGPLVGPSPIRAAPVRPTGVVTAAGLSRCGVEVKVMSNGVQPHPLMPNPAPGSTELRGGSQLVEIRDGLWLGIAHEMKLLPPRRRKYYWHTFYACDARGRMLLRSVGFKLSAHDIEFAAGLAVDDRGGVAISFGTDDHDSWIGVTTVDAILSILRPVRLGAREATEDELASDLAIPTAGLTMPTARAAPEPVGIRKIKRPTTPGRDL